MPSSRIYRHGPCGVPYDPPDPGQLYDGCPLHSHSKRLKLMSTSSGMSELYGLCGTAEETVNMKEILEFFGYSVDAEILTDSAAARGMCLRVGVGAVKHLEVK